MSTDDTPQPEITQSIEPSAHQLEVEIDFDKYVEPSYADLHATSTDPLERSLLTTLHDLVNRPRVIADRLVETDDADDAEELLQMFSSSLKMWLAASKNLHTYYQKGVQRIVIVDEDRVAAGAKLAQARNGVFEKADKRREDDYRDCRDMLKDMASRIDKRAKMARLDRYDEYYATQAQRLGKSAFAVERKWSKITDRLYSLLAKLDAEYLKMSRKRVQIIVRSDRRAGLH